jgi:hypothetical protein
VQTYYFDTKDGVPVRDRAGLQFPAKSAAIEYSKALASKIRGERPKGNRDLYVSVVDESGNEIHREPVYQTS